MQSANLRAALAKHERLTVHRWSWVELQALDADDPSPAEVIGVRPTMRDGVLDIPAVHPAIRGRFAYFFKFDDGQDSGQLWDADLILGNWAVELQTRHQRAMKAAAQIRGVRLVEYERWVAQTRALANSCHPGLNDEFPELMTTAADAIERGLSWPAKRVIGPPRDIKGLTQLYVSIHLWVFDQVLEAVNGFERRAWTAWCKRHWAPGTPPPPDQRARANAIRFLFDKSEGPIMVPESEADAWKMRIKRLSKRIRPGEHDNLVADVLDALRWTT